jgi:hypothetical protein
VHHEDVENQARRADLPVDGREVKRQVCGKCHPVPRVEAEEPAEQECPQRLWGQAQRDDVPADQKERDHPDPTEVEVMVGPALVGGELVGEQVLEEHGGGRETAYGLQELDASPPVPADGRDGSLDRHVPPSTGIGRGAW